MDTTVAGLIGTTVAGLIGTAVAGLIGTTVAGLTVSMDTIVAGIPLIHILQRTMSLPLSRH
jgi:uncharacterized membrane protein YeaQ/YmgE (transglycosylase-associated protein family)